MASSIINSDDGVVSGTSGLKTTGGDDGVLNIQNNGTTAVTVNASGNVGIGTTSPSNPLHVYNATVNGVALFESGDANGGIALKDNSTTQNIFLLAETDDFYIQTGGSERMRIDDAGLVGINNNDPAYTLEVGGGIKAQTFLYVNPTINDDAVYTITRYTTIGGIIVTARNNSYNTVNGFAQWRVGSGGFATLIASSSTVFVVNTISGVPTGTSGTDGKVTLFARTDASGLYIENRSGVAISISIVIIGN